MAATTVHIIQLFSTESLASFRTENTSNISTDCCFEPAFIHSHVEGWNLIFAYKHYRIRFNVIYRVNAAVRCNVKPQNQWKHWEPHCITCVARLPAFQLFLEASAGDRGNVNKPCSTLCLCPRLCRPSLMVCASSWHY